MQPFLNYFRMNYKETLYFIAQCLTISFETKHKEKISNAIKNDEVDWDKVVQVSTKHYVFSAVYCNLKRADLLSYLPEDLVGYMIHITDLNRARNEQIIAQAKALNEILCAQNITPIYAKGTGFLLTNLYEDLGERMVGDIDFLLSEKDCIRAMNILQQNGYDKIDTRTYDYPNFKHYPRLVTENQIAAIEVHKQLVIEEYAAEFNFETVSKEAISHDNFQVLSIPNQLTLSIIAKQINDDGHYFKNMALRNAYDVFLLSQKTNAQEALAKYEQLFNPLNCFLASCHLVFGEIESLDYTKTTESKTYLAFFEKQLLDATLRKKHYQKWKVRLFLRKRLLIIFKTIYKKEYRSWFFKRITDKNWLKEKVRQLRTNEILASEE